MSTTLRELVATVVFRADPTQLKAFDARLDAAKSKLVGIAATAKKGVHARIDSAPVVAFIAKLRLMGDEFKTLPGRAATAFARIAASARRAPMYGPIAPPGLGNAGAAGGAAEAGKGLGGVAKLLGGLGAAATAYKVLNWHRGLIDEAKAVGELAARLSIGTDELQTWTLFAERAGGSSEDLAGSVKDLSRNMQAAAADGAGPVAKAFQRLGVSTANWGTQMPKTMDVLLAAGGALSSLGSDAERLAVAQQLLGESGLRLLPAFKGGEEAARKQLAMLRDLAVVYDEDFIAASKEATLELDLFDKQMKGVGVQIVLAVLPALRDLVRWFTPVAKSIRNVLRDTHVLSAALGVLGMVGATHILPTLGKLITKFGGFSKLLQAGTKIALRYILPFLALDDIITFLTGGESVIGDILNEMFGAGAAADIVDELHKAWDLTWGAIKSLGKTLEFVFNLLTQVGDEGEDAAERTESGFLKASEGIGKAFDSLFDGLKKTWDDMRDIGKEQGPTTFAEAVAISRGEIQPRKLGENRDPRYQKGGELYGDHGEGVDKGTLRDVVQPFVAKYLPMSADIAKRNADSALALGGSPAAGAAASTSVTLTDNSTITSNLNGIDATNVGAALRQHERTVKAELTRNRAQVYKQTVGSARH